jgi:NADPH2:quinone reductase
MKLGPKAESYRAVVSDVLGPLANYTLREIAHRPLAPDELRVAVKAAGVSFVDVLVAEGRYQARPPVPFVPGSECAGTVVEVGSRVSGFRVGDDVMGSGWAGMFAESVILKQDAAWPMPSGLSYAEAATLPVNYLTAWHALVDRGLLRDGETLLVLGAAGGTGYAAVQIGVHLGARVIASASTQEKRALVKAAGAHVVVDSSSPDWRSLVEAANGGLPIDVVFDPVGGEGTERSFRTLAYGGRHLVVGFPAGTPALPTNLPLLKSASLVGVNLPAFSQAHPLHAANHQKKVFELASAGRLKPAIFRTYRLEDFAAAMTDARSGDPVGRIAIALD